MRKAVLPLLTLFCLVISLVGAPSRATAQRQPPPKVSSQAWQKAAAAGVADVIITAPGYPDLSPAQYLTSKQAKTRFVVAALMHYADSAQASVRQALTQRHLPHRILWVTNSIALPAVDQATLQWLAARDDVARIDLDVQTRGVEPISVQQTQAQTRRPDSIAWGVQQVNAPQVWALGYRGQGIVIADLDTGVQWNHPALQPHYRGWNGVTATHDFNWFDPVGTSQGVPSDDFGHGTHTVGTQVGDDGAGNQVGVAPAAQWIACRNMNAGWGTVSLYTACFQFALAPTDVNGNNPDPARAADITSNSWSCQYPQEAGCDVPSSLVTVTQVLRSAGILVVAAAGNQGSGCSSVIYAPGTYDQSFSIGATDSSNAIASFSSRGPSAFSGHLKPDLVAPGVSVLSTLKDGGYGLMSGTSMATPHVAGVAALLWSAAPGLRGQVDETEAILRRTARPLTTITQTCGGVPGTAVPNNTFGYGLIDAQAAVSEAMRGVLTATVVATTSILEPITFTVRLTNYAAITRTNTVITAQLPASTTLAGMTPTGLQNGQTLSWTVPQVLPNSSVTLSFAVIPNVTGMVTLSNYQVSYTDGSAASLKGQPASTFVYGARLWLTLVMR
jgi:uncharacterized repeat protein (TIGR01451 family)